MKRNRGEKEKRKGTPGRCSLHKNLFIRRGDFLQILRRWGRRDTLGIKARAGAATEKTRETPLECPKGKTGSTFWKGMHGSRGNAEEVKTEGELF